MIASLKGVRYCTCKRHMHDAVAVLAMATPTGTASALSRQRTAGLRSRLQQLYVYALYRLSFIVSVVTAQCCTDLSPTPNTFTLQ